MSLYTVEVAPGSFSLEFLLTFFGSVPLLVSVRFDHDRFLSVCVALRELAGISLSAIVAVLYVILLSSCTGQALLELFVDSLELLLPRLELLINSKPGKIVLKPFIFILYIFR